MSVALSLLANLTFEVMVTVESSLADFEAIHRMNTMLFQAAAECH